MTADDELSELLRDSAVWEKPGPGLEDRVIAAIAREVALSRQAASAEPLASIPARRQQKRYVLIGIAAAAVLAIGAATLFLRDTSNAPRVEVALAATDLVPEARGSATMTRTTSGWRIELVVTGLPRLDNDRFYQAWLLDAAGMGAPVGTFNEGRHVTLWAGLSPLQYATFSITEEEADGEQASSGRRVLTGTVDQPSTDSADA
jgi:anti-sigma-K factor RskA